MFGCAWVADEDEDELVEDEVVEDERVEDENENEDGGEGENEDGDVGGACDAFDEDVLESMLLMSCGRN